jgi:hypothetical protein
MNYLELLGVYYNPTLSTIHEYHVYQDKNDERVYSEYIPYELHELLGPISPPKPLKIVRFNPTLHKEINISNLQLKTF